MSATVKYQVGTYEGTIQVPSDSDDDDDVIISRAKRKLFSPSGIMYGMGMCYEHYEIVDRY